MTQFEKNLKEKIDIQTLLENYDLISKGYNKLSQYCSKTFNNKDNELYLHCRNTVIKHCDYLLSNPNKCDHSLYDLSIKLDVRNPNGIGAKYFTIYSFILYNICNSHGEISDDIYHYIRGLITAISLL